MKKVLLLLVMCASFGLMMAQEAEVIKGILPTGLTSSVTDNNATFKFYSNSAAESAQLIFYDATSGEQVGTYDLTGVVEGNNEFVVPCTDLPGTDGQQMNWAVKLVGKPITEFTLINNPEDFTYTQVFCAVDNNPESDFFGRIYVGNRNGNNDPDNGMWIYNPDYTRVNSEVIKTRSDGLNFRSNYRMSIDSEGKVYVPDWGDPTSGVFVFDPANPEAGFKEFFSNPDGTSLNRDGDGLITNAAGEAVGGSSPGVGIVGSGANTKLYVYNEDIKVDDIGNNVSLYNIGNADGTIATSWNKAPDATYAIGAIQLNTNGNVVGDEEHGGVWVAQYRSAGNNASNIPSLIYVNAAGEIVFNSGDAPTNEFLNGSERAGFAISADNKTLVINDGSNKAKVFNIAWTEGVPSLEYVTMFDSGLGSVYQMHFDYAGNLIMSGKKVAIFACPTDENVTIVPAKKSLLVQHTGGAEHVYSVAGSLEDVFGAVWSDTNEQTEMTKNEDGVYEWTSNEFEIAAGTKIEFKVVEDHSWTVSYGENGGDGNASVTADKDGKYTLTVYYEPDNEEVPNNVYGKLELIEESLGKVYILGEVEGNDWATNVGVEMETEDGKIYTKDVILDLGENGIAPKVVDPIGGNKYCYFSFATKLMEAADDWNGLAPYRFGAVSEATEDNPNGDFRFYKNMMGQPLSLTADNGKAFQVEEGTYTLTVDMEAMTLTIVGESKTAIETINLDNKVKSGRYNLMGQPVDENYKGIVIENGVKKIQR